LRILFCISFLFSLALNAQVVSSFNKLPIEVKNSNTYSFFVGGHFHGSSTNISGFPAASLLANIEKLNSDSASFLISTGDLFLDVQNNVPTYKKTLFDKLKMPIFNAVGNHDVSGDVYNKNFGKTWFQFVVGSELYIILDAEINDGSIQGEQFSFLKDALETNCHEGSTIKNVFIFSHRPVWTDGNKKLQNIFLENTQADFGTNFKDDVYPLINTYSKKATIFWFSGSLGANAPASFFYFKDENNVTYIQSAIRDLPRDGIIKVNISNSIISFVTISFTEEKMPALESCGLDLWSNVSKQSPFNYRLIPLYIKQMVFHRYFWYGILSGVFIVLIFNRIRKKIKSRKLG
jgi:hypothetical protein